MQWNFNQWQFCAQTDCLSGAHGDTQLENRQAQLLKYFLENPNRKLDKQELFDRVWQGRVVNEDALYVCIANLRKLLKDDSRNPQFIRTLPGKGYEFLVTPQRLSLESDEAAPTEKLTDTGGASQHHRARLWFQRPKAAMVSVFIACVMAASVWWYVQEHSDSIDTLTNTQAEDFRHARYLLRQGGEENVQQAYGLLEKLEQAVPEFALSSATLAYHHVYANFAKPSNHPEVARARTWIKRALSADANEPVALIAQANLSFGIDWQFEKADEYYRKAIATGRADASHYYDYGQFLLALRRYDRALEMTGKFQDLSVDGYSIEAVAWIQLMSERYDLAQESLSKLLATNPQSFYYHVSQQAIHESAGRWHEAYQELQWLMKTAGYPKEELAVIDSAYQEGGLPAAYRWLLEEDQRDLYIGHYTAPLSKARYAVFIGEYQTALDFLEQAVDARQGPILWVGSDPRYKPLHGYLEFSEILNNLGLPQKRL